MDNKAFEMAVKNKKLLFFDKNPIRQIIDPPLHSPFTHFIQ
jgi:hypothetical protein